MRRRLVPIPDRLLSPRSGVFRQQKSTAAYHLSLVTLALLAAAPLSRGQGSATVTTLHSFSGSDGAKPIAGLILAADGNLYGTTSGNGTNNDGTVFKITTAGAFANLFTFTGNANGSTPEGGLVQGGSNNLYGTTSGLTNNTAGTVFRITTAGALTTLYSFTDSTDGSDPESSLLLDGTTFIGTTSGGSTGFGSAYEVSTSGTFGIIYDFTGSSDGGNPTGSLVLGGDGNLYGTTSTDGDDGAGTVFQITPAGAVTTIHAFTGGDDGATPVAGLVKPGDGYFYGTTTGGGTSGDGTVFRISTGGTLTTLYAFTGGTDGSVPATSLLVGSDGALYGTATQGGSSGNGTVFRITTAGAFTSLYSFSGTTDGSDPTGSLIEGSNGTFYGTTYTGGADNLGTVFALTVRPTIFAGQIALGNDVYYLDFSNGNYFGYYSFLPGGNYIYHFDLGYEYVFDANDGSSGAYFYDFDSSDFFYTSPSFPFPYLYDFNLKSVLYYFANTSSAGHYTTNPRYFYNFATGTIITK